MTEYFLAQAALGGGSTPATTNDGLDRFGWNLSAASYDDLDGGHGNGDHLLTAGSGTPFASYTWTSGDRVYISGSTITDGLYEIASKVSSTELTLTDSAGSDESGSVSSSDGPWGDATNDGTAWQYMFDTLSTPGDICNICDGAASASWAPTGATIDVDTHVGGSTTGDLIYRGVDVRGTAFTDGSQITIDGSGMTAGVDILTLATGNRYLQFENIRLTDANRHAVSSANANTSYITWINIRTDNCDDSGWLFRPTYNSYIECEWDHNAQMGFEGTNTSFTGSLNSFLMCRWHHNGTTTAHHGMGGTQAGRNSYVGCLFYRNAGDGLTNNSQGTGIYIIECISAFNGGSGYAIYPNSSRAWSEMSVYNCIAHENGGYGWKGPSSALVPAFALFDYNCFHNNTSGAITPSTFSIGDNSITSDPLFTSEVDGSEDFTPQAGSPLEDAGIEVPAS